MWAQYATLHVVENITIEVAKWSIIVESYKSTYTLEVTISSGKFYNLERNIFHFFYFHAFFQFSHKSAKEIIRINILKLS